MKHSVLVLALLTVLLAAVLWLSRQSAAKQIAAARDENRALSQQITESKTSLTDLMKQHLALRDSLSNRLAEATILTQRFERASTNLVQARTTLTAAREQLQTIESQRASLLSERDQWGRERAELTNALATVRSQLTAVTARAQALDQQRRDLQADLNQLRSELIQHHQRFQDPAVLRVQLAKLKELGPPRQASESNAGARSSGDRSTNALNQQPSGTSPSDRAANQRLRLELQPDGSVRAVPEQAVER